MHPGASSSVAVLTGVLTMSNMGAAISEVMNDALVAEAVKNKQGARQGELFWFLCSKGFCGDRLKLRHSAKFLVNALRCQNLFGIWYRVRRKFI